MIETFIKDKLYQACTVSVLTSGLKLVSIATRPNEYFVTLSFPHIINDDNTLTPYLMEAHDRRVDVMAYQVVIAKKVNQKLADTFFTSVLTNELKPFIQFVEDFTIGLATTTDSESTEDNRVLH